jgi:hypothetical protein
MLMSSRKDQGPGKGGKDLFDESFEDNAAAGATLKKLQDKQAQGLKVKEGSQLLQKELMHRNRK